MVPKRLVQRHRIPVTPTEQRVWAANRSEIEITGEVVVPFVLNDRRVDTFALVTPDVEEVMIGSGWMEEHQCVWNFGGKELYIDGYPAVTLSRRKHLRCRRLFSEGDVVIPPRQQVITLVRSTLMSLKTSERDGNGGSQRGCLLYTSDAADE